MRKSLCYNCRIIPQLIQLPNILIINHTIIVSICTFIHSNHGSASQSKVMLQSDFRVWDKRLLAQPRNCHTSSAHWAMSVAPKGWPFDISPPEGFITTLPPYVMFPLRIISCAFPGGQRPGASMVIISLAEKQSCSSQTVMSSAVTPPSNTRSSWKSSLPPKGFYGDIS